MIAKRSSHSNFFLLSKGAIT